MNVILTTTPRIEPSRRYLHAKLTASDLVRLSAHQDGGALQVEGYTLPGFQLDDSGTGGVAKFDRQIYSEEQARILVSHMQGGTLYAATTEERGEAVTARELTADDGRLRKAKKHMIDSTITADELYFYERFPANDAMSRGGDIQLTTAAIRKVASDFNAGRSQLLHHDTKQVVGRIFSAEVVQAKREGVEANYIRYEGYIPRRESNAGLIDDLRMGVLAYDSIGFNGGEVEMVETRAGDRVSYHIRVDYKKSSLRPLEASESSFVFLGHLRGAGNAKLEAPIHEPTSGAPNADDGTPSPIPSEGSIIFLR